MATSATAVSIGTLLNAAAKPIRVPRVQRPYSWEASETKELWEDILEFYNRYPGDTIHSREYFMGAIVGQEQEDTDGSFVEILDGQQRLATLTILLSVLRDRLEPADPKGAQSIQLSNIAKFVRLNTPSEFLLTLNKVDRSFFRQTIQEFPRSDHEERSASHTLIRKARDYFDRKFVEHAEVEDISQADLAYRLHSVIATNLKVVFINSGSWDDASDVFERLNDRGKGLSTLNLLRNHVLSKAPSHQLDDVEGFWEQVYSLSQSASKVDTFLRHVWITHRGDVKKQSLFKEIKAVMATPSTPEALKDPYKFSSNLASDAEMYKEILASRHNDPGCARWLRAIQTMGATALLPAALASSDGWQDTASQMKLLRALVATFVRFSIIAGGDSSSLESAAYKVAYNVRSGCSLEEALAILRPLLRTDEQVKEYFKTLSIPNAKSGYQRHILEELENHASDATGDKTGGLEKSAAGSSVLWIEHIYPQSPGNHWSRWEKHDSLVNRIGNITLVHKKLNATASNKPFATKKSIYADSGLALNRYLDGLDEWDPQQVEKRQNELASQVPLVWPAF
ncbi:hypothetical protein M2161_005366 [Streptomyces sp. SAI-133]|uniref:DUF262 domain-containing protein n=1 Tax=unclassified Streptomyces TaxID=2593676 RepID=UPI00247382D6|nr:DUF262 domain-containing protein [Streptomyces sp. SAI-133]MDH6586260.1 hypothetical protein [Streptomyces sp. SAI-133]